MSTGMKLAKILITSGREAETKQTLETYHAFNGWDAMAPFPVVALHGDDCSITQDNCRMADDYGYSTVVRSKTKRLGAHEMRSRMIDAAIEHGATHIFVLENDWECVREMPWAAIIEAFRLPVWCMRLYYTQKQADGKRPAGDVHAGRDNCDPRWEAIYLRGLECEMGDIHWGAPPHIAKAETLKWLHTDTISDSASMRKSGQIQEHTIRVMTNVFWHIGYERTPGFRR